MSTDAGTRGGGAGMAAQVRLVDHHCHGVVAGPLDRPAFELLATEAGQPAPAGTTHLDSQVGVAIRAWCAPVLDLPRHAPAERYLARRAELGPEEVNRRLLRAAAIDLYLVETGYGGDEILTPSELGALAGAPAREVVRLEAVAEQVARAGCSADGFAAAFAEALATRAAEAVGLKSIVAYRYGLDFDPARPSPADVRAAASRWLVQHERGGAPRLEDPVLLRHVLWAGVDLARDGRRLPLQLHVGYGDADLDLHRCDPLLMTDFLRAVQPLGVAVMLLHCYPYHRQAGYLAQVFPHVYMDVGLALNYVGARAHAVLAESLELTPFHKALFSTDAFGLAELYTTGAVLFRRGLARILGGWVAEDLMAAADATRAAAAVAGGNARRVYGLEAP